MEWALSIAIAACYFMIAALAFDLVAGHGGMFSLGSSGIMAVSGYAYAILCVTYHWPPLMAAFAGVFSATAVASLSATVLVRLRGDLFALGSFGLYRIVQDMALNAEVLSPGASGLPGVPAVLSCGSRALTSFGIGVICLAAVLWLYLRVTRSAFGRVLRSVRDEPVAATQFGQSPLQVRSVAFALHGIMLGLAGVILASYQGSVAPDLFDFQLSLSIVAMSVIGGLATWRGACVGVLVVLGIRQITDNCFVTPWLAGSVSAIVVYGVLVGFLVLRPQGIFGSYFHLSRPGKRQS